MNMRLGRTAFNCYSVIMVFRGCITFIKWQEKVAEAILEKNPKNKANGSYFTWRRAVAVAYKVENPGSNPTVRWGLSSSLHC